MKNLLFILALAFTLQLSAQDNLNWISDNGIAQKHSENQNKPILVFVTNNPKIDVSALLKNLVNNDKLLTKISTNAILLMLDVSDTKSSNARFGIHYTKQTGAPGLSLIDNHGKTLINPLVDFNSEEKVLTFLTLLNDKI
nr:hypothetical protein [uncultured Psychroserpens sp.]